MKFLFPTGISATAISIICFVVLLRDVSGFTPTVSNSMTKTALHRQIVHYRLSMVQLSDEFSMTASSSSPTPYKGRRVGVASDAFLKEYIQSDIDDVNLPPSMSIIRRSIVQLASGSDIRGQYVPHPTTGRMAELARSIGQTTLPALTPFAAHCLGFAFATMMKEQQQLQGQQDEEVAICIGRDPREHGVVLADSFARGAGGVKGIKCVYTGIATTPALFDFCRYVLSYAVSFCDYTINKRDRKLPVYIAIILILPVIELYPFNSWYCVCIVCVPYNSACKIYMNLFLLL